jgi:hypothetical protein
LSPGEGCLKEVLQQKFFWQDLMQDSVALARQLYPGEGLLMVDFLVEEAVDQEVTYVFGDILREFVLVLVSRYHRYQLVQPSG